MARIISDYVGANIDHNNLADLTVGDDHTQYALLAGRGGGTAFTGTLSATGRITSSTDFLSLGGGQQVWKDSTPTKAINFSMNTPGQPISNDLYFSMYNGTAWLGVFRILDTSGIISLEPTTGALILHRLTTTQRDALTPVNGMLIYNSSTNKFQGYEAGAWVNLI